MNKYSCLKEKWLQGKTGVTPDLNFSERLKVEWSNQFALFGLSLVLIHTIRNVFGENLYSDNLTSLRWVLQVPVQNCLYNNFVLEKLTT